MSTTEIKARLEYLRTELRAERISYGEIVELQGLIPHIKKDDVELLEAAGVLEGTLPFKIGDKVLYTDPDDNLTSGVYTVVLIKGEIYALTNKEGSEVEAFEHELEPVPPMTPELERVLYNCAYGPLNPILSYSATMYKVTEAIGFELKVRAVKFVGYQSKHKKIHQYGVTGYDVLKQYALRLGHDPKLKRHLRVRDRAVYLMNWLTDKLS